MRCTIYCSVSTLTLMTNVQKIGWFITNIWPFCILLQIKVLWLFNDIFHKTDELLYPFTCTVYIIPLQRHKDESFWSFISLLILEQIVKNVNDRLLKEAHIYFISFFFLLQLSNWFRWDIFYVLCSGVLTEGELLFLCFVIAFPTWCPVLNTLL